jgi:hypothetical protein
MLFGLRFPSANQLADGFGEAGFGSRAVLTSVRACRLSCKERRCWTSQARNHARGTATRAMDKIPNFR